MPLWTRARPGAPLPNGSVYVLATAELYQLRKADAQAELARLRKVIGSWEQRAKTLGMSAEDRLELEDRLMVWPGRRSGMSSHSFGVTLTRQVCARKHNNKSMKRVV